MKPNQKEKGTAPGQALLGWIRYNKWENRQQQYLSRQIVIHLILKIRLEFPSHTPNFKTVVFVVCWIKHREISQPVIGNRWWDFRRLRSTPCGRSLNTPDGRSHLRFFSREKPERVEERLHYTPDGRLRSTRYARSHSGFPMFLLNGKTWMCWGAIAQHSRREIALI
jgi:hypothetical protein